MADIDITVGMCRRCRRMIADDEILCPGCAKDELASFVGSIVVPSEAQPDAATGRLLFGRPAAVEDFDGVPPVAHLHTLAESGVLVPDEQESIAAIVEVVPEPSRAVADGVEPTTTKLSPAYPAPSTPGPALGGLAAVIAVAFERHPATPPPAAEPAAVTTSPVPDDLPVDDLALDRAALDDPLVAEAETFDVVDSLLPQGLAAAAFTIPDSWLETRPAWYELDSTAELEQADELVETPAQVRSLRRRGIARVLLGVALAAALMVLVALWTGDDSASPDVTISSPGVDIDEETPAPAADAPDAPAAHESQNTPDSVPPTSPPTPPAGIGNAGPAPAPTVAAPSASAPAPNSAPTHGSGTGSTSGRGSTSGGGTTSGSGGGGTGGGGGNGNGHGGGNGGGGGGHGGGGGGKK